MTWVQIQTAQDATWDDYEAVAREVGDEAPEGLIAHAAGVYGGNRWRSVSIWESEEAFNRFRDERLMPAVTRALGEELVAAGPPPSESFEVKHLVRGSGGST
jgi:heme-degrading monooxygenase HmoA